MNPSNYTNAELYRLTDTLPRERIEKLIDDEYIIEKLSDIESCLSDAVSSMPDEDCFHEEIKSLTDLCKRLRGDNKDALSNIIKRLTEERDSMMRSVEYAVEEINKYSKELSEC